MIKEGNTTGTPQFAPTVHAPAGSIPSDRWTGTKLGKYHIIRRLGRGGMGVVYEAKDPVLDRSVAVKVLRDGLAAHPESVRRFLREARTAARLNHPQIVAIFEADEQKGMCYLVMELMEGGSAHDRIRKWGGFGWVEATQVAIDACRGLAAVHAAGLIHRDIKPSNVMRSKEGAVKLADFGLALTTTGATPPDPGAGGQVVGTPFFMSPEQCRADKIDARSDVYALGATYYTLLTGKPPFDGLSATDIMIGHCSQVVPDVRTFDRQIPSACSELIQRTMAKNPAERPASAEALLAELETVILLATSPEIQVLDWTTPAEKDPPPTTLVESIPPSPRRRTRAWFILICLLLMGGAYGVGRYLSQSRVEPTNDVTAQNPNPENPGGEERTPIEFDAGGQVESLAFDPQDKELLGWGTLSGGMRVMRLPYTGYQQEFDYSVPRKSMPHSVDQVAFSTDGACWTGLFNGTLDFRDTFKFLRMFNETEYCSLPQAAIASFAWHPVDRKFLALGFRYDDDVIRSKGLAKEAKEAGIAIRNFTNDLPAGTSRDVIKYTEGSERPRCLAFSTDGSLLVSARSRKLNLWNVSIKKNECSVKSGGVTLVGSGEITAIAAIDTFRFAVGHGSKISIFDPRKGTPVEVFAGKELVRSLVAIPCPAGSSCPQRLAFSVGTSVMIYDLGNRQVTSEFHDHNAAVTALAVDASGKTMASGDEKGKVRVWPVK